jgi:hypothetical protein
MHIFTAKAWQVVEARPMAGSAIESGEVNQPQKTMELDG